MDLANYKIWGHDDQSLIVACVRCQAPFLDVIFEIPPGQPTAMVNRDLAAIVAAAEAHEAEVHG